MPIQWKPVPGIYLYIIMNKENKSNSIIKQQKKTYLCAAHAVVVNLPFKMNPLPSAFLPCVYSNAI